MRTLTRQQKIQFRKTGRLPLPEFRPSAYINVGMRTLAPENHGKWTRKSRYSSGNGPLSAVKLDTAIRRAYWNLGSKPGA